jgi:hypothetical protein
MEIIIIRGFRGGKFTMATTKYSLIQTPTEAAGIHTVGDHTVATIRNRATGIVIHEEWDMDDGTLDRADGPALTNRDPITGIVTFEAWCKNGKAERMDGPADIHRDPHTGVVTYEAWKKGGELNRADGWAATWRDAATGKVTGQEMWRDGHHVGRADGGPDCINRDAKTGVVTYEAWHNNNGDPDRADGPARIERDAGTGVVTGESWWTDGHCNRSITRDPATGKIVEDTRPGGKAIDIKLNVPTPAGRKAALNTPSI